MSDPRVTAMPVVDCGERLVSLADTPQLLLDRRLADPAGAFSYVREELVGRLLAAQNLLPAGLRLLIIEGYRPPELQVRYFDEYSAELRAANPGWSDEHLHVQTSRSLAPPAIAPHTCGAAVDLTLCTEAGDELPMGTEVNTSPEQNAGACFTDAPNISALARSHRSLLSAVMTSAGFVNYVTEWWHWSYGDRYWAVATGAPAARYGLITEPPRQ
ncbi:M15 family metallopeptidase [Streptomyces sp. TP-A0356]|uniref:M15 family metallopeptidase n=1 Tax=Streptomyces sp. TP-A0356 TaxID=1359208 RepID=UPI0006E41B7F|nr:M15 family metallopeptidase [Streptomyces sp. TP-A0356]